MHCLKERSSFLREAKWFCTTLWKQVVDNNGVVVRGALSIRGCCVEIRCYYYRPVGGGAGKTRNCACVCVKIIRSCSCKKR